MSYSAVEAIWKKAQKSPSLEKIAELMIEGFLGKPLEARRNNSTPIVSDASKEL